MAPVHCTHTRPPPLRCTLQRLAGQHPSRRPAAASRAGAARAGAQPPAGQPAAGSLGAASKLVQSRPGEAGRLQYCNTVSFNCEGGQGSTVGRAPLEPPPSLFHPAPGRGACPVWLPGPMSAAPRSRRNARCGALLPAALQAHNNISGPLPSNWTAPPGAAIVVVPQNGSSSFCGQASSAWQGLRRLLVLTVARGALHTASYAILQPARQLH